MLMEQTAPIHLASLFLQNYNDKKKFDADITGDRAFYIQIRSKIVKIQF